MLFPQRMKMLKQDRITEAGTHNPGKTITVAQPCFANAGQSHIDKQDYMDWQLGIGETKTGKTTEKC